MTVNALRRSWVPHPFGFWFIKSAGFDSAVRRTPRSCAWGLRYETISRGGNPLADERMAHLLAVPANRDRLPPDHRFRFTLQAPRFSARMQREARQWHWIGLLLQR